MSSSRVSFAADVDFLRQHGDVLLLRASHGACVAVSAKYQGRVMTSTVSPAGPSLGWVNRPVIAASAVGTAFDNYGGEDRFWLGPEGGQFALFFAPGTAFELEHWQTPHELQEGTWEPSAVSDNSIEFSRVMRVNNHAGTGFELTVGRRIAVMDVQSVAKELGVTPAAEVQWVAFRSCNQVTNTSTTAWTEQAGLISIWSLGMFAPADDTWVIVPFEKAGQGPIVSSDYFGALPPERLRVDEASGVVTFLADGKYRSKIGLSQSRSRPVAGSYTASEKRLTIIRYSVPQAPQPYVNSTWQVQEQPYAGDLFNSYNHGTSTPGQLAEFRFYELESSSPGALLSPGETLRHEHQTYHFIGERPFLDAIAQQVLGVSLSVVPGP